MKLLHWRNSSGSTTSLQQWLSKCAHLSNCCFMDWLVTQVIFRKFKALPHQKYFNLLWSYHSMILRKHMHLNTFDVSALDSKETALKMEKLSEHIMWLALQCTTKWHQNIGITSHYLQSPTTSTWASCAHINIIIFFVNIDKDSSVQIPISVDSNTVTSWTERYSLNTDTIKTFWKKKTHYFIICTDITQDLETPSVAYN
jgi:hypothetical protein